MIMVKANNITKILISILVVMLVFISFDMMVFTSCNITKREDQPMNINECNLIYYNNREDFNIVKNYLLENYSDNFDFWFNFDDLDDFNLNDNVKDAFISLEYAGIKSIRFMVVNHEYKGYEYLNEVGKIKIAFKIASTESTEYGILWRNAKNNYATDEMYLEENWYSYIIVGT